MKKLIIVNLVILALIALFIRANLNVSKKYTEVTQKTEATNEIHIAAK